jgi:hypothetical protein
VLGTEAHGDRLAMQLSPLWQHAENNVEYVRLFVTSFKRSLRSLATTSVPYCVTLCAVRLVVRQLRQAGRGNFQQRLDAKYQAGRVCDMAQRREAEIQVPKGDGGFVHPAHSIGRLGYLANNINRVGHHTRGKGRPHPGSRAPSTL